jgi:hypothetical protein
MSDGGFTINVDASVLQYLEQKALSWFGKDAESQELTAWFRGLQEAALLQSASVHCIGMKAPIAFESIYQPTKLVVGPDPNEVAPRESYSWKDRVTQSMVLGRRYSQSSISVDEFLLRDQDALIFSGPGWGKTTFLHHVYRLTARHDFLLPVLISLRRPKAVEDLEKYVDVCLRIQKRISRACSLLLVDGFDEIDTVARRRVSEALFKFQSLRAGKYYLTCRDYYQVPSQVMAPEVRLEAFTREDQVRFVRVFLDTFSVYQRENPEQVVSQLEERGFKEFLSHPLLLTLACIVRSTSTSLQPRSALRLLEYALDVLRFRWDEHKSIDRQRTTQLDGSDRIRILKHIAYAAKSPFVKAIRAEVTAQKQLALLGWDKVQPRDALVEIAQFYGILVPAEDGYEFVHRTIHDFLAAKQWVESGEFVRPQQYEWNARTGYAACFIEDSTDILGQALAAPDGLPTVTEIIGNFASFPRRPVADLLLKYFGADGRILHHERHSPTLSESGSKYSPHIQGQLDNDFIRLADSCFLDFIIEYCCDRTSRAADLMVAYAACELHARRVKLTHESYNKALAAYKSEFFTFVVPGAKQVQLQFLCPVPRKRLKLSNANEITG